MWPKIFTRTRRWVLVRREPWLFTGLLGLGLIILWSVKTLPPSPADPSTSLDAGFLIGLLRDWEVGQGGDLNGDGATDYRDALLLSIHWYGFSPGPSPTSTFTAAASATPSRTPTVTSTPSPTATDLASISSSFRVIPLIKDTYLSSATPSAVNGHLEELRIREGGENQTMVSLIRFDLSDLATDTEVMGAYLTLLPAGNPSTQNCVFSIHEVLGEWEEDQTNWQTRPPWSQNALTSVPASENPDLETFVDLTSIVRAWIQGEKTNYGLVLKIPSNQAGRCQFIFGSRESASPPSLNLAYDVPARPASPFQRPTPTAIPPAYSEVVLSPTSCGYVRWNGYETYDMNFPDPGALILSHDLVQPLIEGALLGFDLTSIPFRSEIYQASLELYLEAGDNPELIAIRANMMDTPWSPDRVTWASVHGASNRETDAPRGYVVVGTDPGWKSMDVTRILRRWMRNPDWVYGFYLLGSDSSQGPWMRRFSGCGARRTQPRLIIRYGPSTKGEMKTSRDIKSTLPPINCTPVSLGLPPLLRKNWDLISSMVTLSGRAEGPHVTHTDWPSSHSDHDFCFDLKGNSATEWAFGKDNPDGIEVEWEVHCWPPWAWPTEGDQTIVFGAHIYDCGHGIKTEIHPPRGVVSIRKNVAADISTQGGYGYAIVNRADVFFTNRRSPAYCGGYCEELAPGIPLFLPYVPVNSQDYSFDLYPPSNQDTGAELIAWAVDHSWDWGTPVKPVLTLHSEASPAYVHVSLPYQTSYGSFGWNLKKMHTASSVYCGWSKTKDPDLRAFKISVEGVDVYDDSEGCCMNGGEYYMWMGVNDQWVNLRNYIPGLEHADEQFYEVQQPLDVHVIVPNTPSGKIHIGTHGYESDCWDDLYGWTSGWPLYLVALACFSTDNDTLQHVDLNFTQKQGYGVSGPTTYKSNDDGGDGRYGLRLSITEQDAPIQPRFIKAGIAGQAINLNDGLIPDEYKDSQVIGFPILNQYGLVEIQSAYDQHSLSVCLSGIEVSGNANNLLDSREVVLYLDPGDPSKPKTGSSWLGREDDLRVAFRTSPNTGVTAALFDPSTGWYTKMVSSSLVEGGIYQNPLSVKADVELRIDESLIPRGPWSQTVSEETLVKQGIGAYFAVEKPTEVRQGGWPPAGGPNTPNAWARLWFQPACPITLWAKRIGQIADNEKTAGSGKIILEGNEFEITPLGDVVTIQLKYRVGFEHPRCNLVNARLEAFWPDVFDLVSYSPTENAVITGDVLSWNLPPTDSSETEYTFTIHQTRRCEWPSGPSNPCPPDRSIYAGGTLTTNFQGTLIPPVSVSASDSIGTCLCLQFPDVTMWPGGWPIGTVPPWVLLHDPVELQDPFELSFNIANRDPFDRRVIVKALEVPLGISSPHPGANMALDFSNAPENWYSIPANTEINVQLETPFTGYASGRPKQISEITGGAIAVQVFDADHCGGPHVALHQLIPYMPMRAGEGGSLEVALWPTLREPGEVTVRGWSYAPGWDVTVTPDRFPVNTEGEIHPVQIHVQPPTRQRLGSGIPIDLVAWSDTGEIAGELRILDLPPVQFSPDQPVYSSRDILLDPPEPRVGEETRVCAIIRNRSERSVRCEVALGQSAQLSTSPVFEEFFRDMVEVSPQAILRICSNPFPWEGARSFQAAIHQEGYQDQVVHKNAVGIQGPRKETCLMIGEVIHSPETGLPSIAAGPIVFYAAGSLDGLIPINAVDCTGDGEVDVEIPFSNPQGGTMAHIEFHEQACGGSNPIEVQLFLRNGSGLGALHAIDSLGEPAGSVAIQSGNEIQSLHLTRERGIARIDLEGAEICIQRICWECRKEEQFVIPLEIRNPQSNSTRVFLHTNLVGLPGWQVDIPDNFDLPGGGTANIQVLLVPPAYGPFYAGDLSYLEVNPLTLEGEILGGARITVLQ